MALNLNDLMKKAKNKGLLNDAPSSSSSTELLRPWQHESVLYAKTNNGIRERIREPKGNELENQKRTSREPLENQKRTSREPLENQKRTSRERIREPKGNELENELENELGNELENKPTQNSFFELHHLSGIQKKLFNYILSCCTTNDSLTTGFINTVEMAKNSNCSYQSAKVSLKRLIKKGLIIRLKGKRSRAGFIHLEIPKEIKLAALEIHKGSLLGNELENELENKLENRLGNKPSLSSNSLLNITTTDLGEWEYVDLEKYKVFNFTKAQLQQLLRSPKLNFHEIKDSLDHFAFDVDQGFAPKPKAGKSYLHIIMGMILDGRQYFSSNYEKHYTAELKAQAEAIKNAKQAQLEDKLHVWLNTLPNADNADMRRHMPLHLMTAYDAYGLAHEEVKKWVMNYFMNKSST